MVGCTAAVTTHSAITKVAQTAGGGGADIQITQISTKIQKLSARIQTINHGQDWADIHLSSEPLTVILLLRQRSGLQFAV